jgi:hypothetical protein
VLAVDVDGDGDLDLAYTSPLSGELRITMGGW